MLANLEETRHVLVGQSPRTRQVLRLIEKLGKCRWPALLLGETGTGKEVVARSIHNISPSGPFVTIDCSSMVGPLMESELFGHVKGSFTGADNTKIGLIEAANGGTAFFDEIGELPLDLQAKLLRVFRKRNSVRWDRSPRGGRISASSPPPIATWPRKWRGAPSAATSISA